MFDSTTSLRSPSDFPATAEGYSPRDERGFSLFGMTPEHTADYIEWCTREEALEAGRREVEAEADQAFVREMIATDRDTARQVLQARTADLPLAMTLGEVADALGVAAPAKPAQPQPAAPYIRLHTDVMAALFGKA